MSYLTQANRCNRNGTHMGARYLEVRLLLENNGLSNEENIAWELFIRN